MAQRLADPDGIEGTRVRSEKLAHLLGVQLNEADFTLSKGNIPLRVLIALFFLAGRVFSLVLLLFLGSLVFGQSLGHLDLLGRDGDARHGTSQLRGQEPRGASDAAPYI